MWIGVTIIIKIIIISIIMIMHKSELLEILGSLMSDIDMLPIHPENKVLLYQGYVLSKRSRHLTVVDLSKTWVCENRDNMGSKSPVA